jgi:prolyl-tRNA editing enzyme YbaK/EbsC (Cys-tRNA(Pro) deacylase)
MPPIPTSAHPGALPTLLDWLERHAVEHDVVSFNAGTHTCAVRVDRTQWERATHVAYADLAGESDGRPAWARS